MSSFCEKSRFKDEEATRLQNDIASWSVGEVCEWLREKGEGLLTESTIQLFKHHRVDGPSFLRLHLDLDLIDKNENDAVLEEKLATHAHTCPPCWGQGYTGSRSFNFVSMSDLHKYMSCKKRLYCATLSTVISELLTQVHIV